MNDPVSQNILGVQSLVGSKLNKLQTGASTHVEGVESEFIDEFELKMSDEELISLAKTWTTNYAGYEAKLKERTQANKTYYLGRQKEGGQWATTEGTPIGANLLFEAEETFLPAALSKNPEPVVFADNTEEGDRVSNNIKTMLQYHADTLVLRRKLQLTTRHWTIYFIGVLKHGWDDDIGEITTEVRDPNNFIFDPEGFVDMYGDYEGPLGERITVAASRLIDLFPKHKAYITVMVDGKLGTKVTYTEWWTDAYSFYTFKDKILEKNKNPHFNYEPKEEGEAGGTGEVHNHFARPKKPYTFLSVFSLGQQPHDITGLIEQNIPNQRRVSRRTEQIDYNLSRQNNSTVFSENNFTQETAKQASTGMAKGHPILVPSGGPIAEAIHQIPAQGLNNSYFNDLENSKNDLRSIFGTEGISAQPVDKGELATNLVMNERHDSSRIGGGINDAIEQVAKNVFNWWVQLYHVYYNDQHFAAIMGQMKAVEYVTLSNQDLNRQVVVSVSPDSMKPRDEATEINQAMQLFQAGVLDPKTLLTRLNFPDPQSAAEQAVLWIVDKMTYMQLNFPEIAQKVQEQQQMMQQRQAEQEQGQAQAQAQQAQEQQQMQGQQAQQQMQIQAAQKQQEMEIKQQEHQQKLQQAEELHRSKIEQAKIQAIEKGKQLASKPINNNKKK